MRLTKVVNRIRARLSVPQMERRRRARRAANVNARRWRASAAYFRNLDEPNEEKALVCDARAEDWERRKPL